MTVDCVPSSVALSAKLIAAWSDLLFCSMCPHSEHCREVWAESTCTKATAARVALSARNAPNRGKAPEWNVERCGFRRCIRVRMPVRFSTAAPCLCVRPSR